MIILFNIASTAFKVFIAFILLGNQKLYRKSCQTKQMFFPKTHFPKKHIFTLRLAALKKMNYLKKHPIIGRIF